MNFIYNRLFCCNHTCYYVDMVSVTSASRYATSASRYQSYFLDVHPRSDSTDLAGAVPIGLCSVSLPSDALGRLWYFLVILTYLCVLYLFRLCASTFTIGVTVKKWGQ